MSPRRAAGVVVRASLVAAAGCVSTPVVTRGPHPAAARLKNAGAASFRLGVTADLPPGAVVGRQWVFVAVPFGRVVLEDPAAPFAAAISDAWARAGFYAAPPAGTAADEADVTVRLTHVSASAYDALFARRVTCAARAEVRYRGRPGGARLAEVSEGEWRRFGFAPDVTAVFRKCAARLAAAVPPPGFGSRARRAGRDAH